MNELKDTSQNQYIMESPREGSKWNYRRNSTCLHSLSSCSSLISLSSLLSSFLNSLLFLLSLPSLFLPCLILPSLISCTNPQPGPDKTLEGTVLGAGLGSGVGAVIGNQIASVGAGAGVGAGFGAAAGLLNGVAYDRMESNIIRQEHELQNLEARNRANMKNLSELQETLDNQIETSGFSGIYQVFFDEDSTSLKAGAVANIQTIAESIKKDPAARFINVVGHTDDTGDPEHNKRLAEARAREVSANLSARGISSDQIRTSSFGAQRPIASNSTQQGRQLNRRVDIYFGGR